MNINICYKYILHVCSCIYLSDFSSCSFTAGNLVVAELINTTKITGKKEAEIRLKCRCFLHSSEDVRKNTS
jgi:hypothetical protein